MGWGVDCKALLQPEETGKGGGGGGGVGAKKKKKKEEGLWW